MATGRRGCCNKGSTRHLHTGRYLHAFIGLVRPPHNTKIVYIQVGAVLTRLNIKVGDCTASQRRVFANMCDSTYYDEYWQGLGDVGTGCGDFILPLAKFMTDWLHRIDKERASAANAREEALIAAAAVVAAQATAAAAAAAGEAVEVASAAAAVVAASEAAAVAEAAAADAGAGTDTAPPPTPPIPLVGTVNAEVVLLLNADCNEWSQVVNKAPGPRRQRHTDPALDGMLNMEGDAKIRACGIERCNTLGVHFICAD
jgi:hypothetical protein